MGIPKVRPQIRRGPRGLAEVSVEDSRVSVEMKKSGELLSFPRTEENIQAENLVDGTAYVSISRDKETLMNTRPASGTFTVVVDSFASGEGQDPSPKRYEGTGRRKDGTTFDYSYEAFNALLRIVDHDKWGGAIIPAHLRYFFVDAGDGETAGIRNSGKNAEELINFLELAGLDFDDDSIPLSENVLPWLEKTLVDRQRRFYAILENGYVQGYAPLPS